MVEKTKTKRILVALGGNAELMLQEIMKRTSSPSMSAAINLAIFEAHRSFFPAYMQKGTKGLGSSRAARLHDERKEEEAEQIGICKSLEGSIEGQGENKVCTYFTYNLRKRYQQRMSLGVLTVEMVAGQYQPNKEVVMKLKEAGKCDW